MYLSKVTANSDRVQVSKWPLAAILKNITFIIFGSRRAKMTNEVSFSNNCSITNPLEWLFLSFGIILTFKSKMASVRHLEKCQTVISLASLSQAEKRKHQTEEGLG